MVLRVERNPLWFPMDPQGTVVVQFDKFVSFQNDS